MCIRDRGMSSLLDGFDESLCLVHLFLGVEQGFLVAPAHLVFMLPVGAVSYTHLVGSARMILRQHTLSQVVTGFLIGTTCAILVI